MQARPPEVVVDPDKPFFHDKLGRKVTAEELLTPLLKKLASPYVLAIDSPWGTGKTTFIKMWKRQLELEGMTCLYFSAWETDFFDDPLIALTGELASAISKDQRAEGLKGKLADLRRAAAPIVKRAIPTAVRLVTAGVIDFEGIEKELMNLSGKIAEDQINRYEQSRRGLETFRESLSKFVEALQEMKGEREDSAPSLVIFVDELDRCRPTYAIDLLERAKHLFDVPGVVFILGIDKRQIAHSVNAVYGEKFEAHGYLRRFIDIDYPLPSPPVGRFCNLLLQQFDFPITGGDFRDYLSTIIRQFDLSLREEIQATLRLKLALAVCDDSGLTVGRFLSYDHILILLIPIREHDPDLYERITSRNLTDGDMERIAMLSERLASDFPRFELHAARVEGILLAFCSTPKTVPKRVRELEKIAEEHGIYEICAFEKFKETRQALESSGNLIGKVVDIINLVGYLNAERI